MSLHIKSWWTMKYGTAIGLLYLCWKCKKKLYKNDSIMLVVDHPTH